MDFELGLAFTGTVSAGAYAGGVIDFIIEALEEWQKEKDANRAQFGDNYSQWKVPWHNVVIKGLSGASGGGVSCGLILNTIGKQFDHVHTPADAESAHNDFYNAWVEQLGIEQLLAIDDLTGGEIKALLNADAIPAIADKLLVNDNFGNNFPRPYIDGNLIAMLTLTNLRGIPYILQFKSILQQNIIYYRNTDYAKFELATNNASVHPDAILIPYDTSGVAFANGYSLLKAACLCTCAFPGAFKAQPFNQPSTVYAARPDGKNINPLNKPAYSFLSSDGGVLNTEPFMLLHDAITPTATGGTYDDKHNPRSPQDVVRSIIMVAPLEVAEVFDEDGYDITKDGLLSIIKPVIFAMRQDALFSDEEISLAFNEDIYSRFMISPVRNSLPTANDVITPAITGTSVGTFGAFLSKDFREHDYFLGRRNAQQFFRRHFAVPVDEASANPIFGPLNIRAQFSNYIFNDGIDYFSIIPLCGTASTEAYYPQWPTGKGYSEDNIRQLLTGRVDKLCDAVEASLGLGWLKKIIASVVINEVKSTLIDDIMNAVEKSLKDSKL